MFLEKEPKKRLLKIPKNPGRGCPDLFSAFANDCLIEAEVGEIDYYQRR